MRQLDDELTAEPALDPIDGPYRPNLCPAPTPESKRTKSKNSILYQQYVSKLPYGLAINVGGLRYDGCDPRTGDLLEAKADIDFMFDKNDTMYYWAERKMKLAIQMVTRADVALAAGRIVVWRAQTERDFEV